MWCPCDGSRFWRTSQHAGGYRGVPLYSVTLIIISARRQIEIPLILPAAPRLSCHGYIRAHLKSLLLSNVNYMTMVFRLNGYRQMNRDSHERRMVQIRSRLDQLGVHEFACTPYEDQAWDALRPVWMLTDVEQLTWHAAVPIVCFMFVRMHHVDKVKRQLGGEQQIPEDPR
ncbi:hypothetical protein PIB30_059132 [Stylosanthes scabra]|uniref:Uncharacterized protein n=1 Tax=Stylosanthes scabra TaxID=79078 RepID=A0ABU6UK07_9FABA|nr:hypothetical protein [Stylosanthes scabra]